MPIDPVTGMLIGSGINAAGGILSGIMGSRAQDEANAIQWANYQAQEQANFLQRIMAERQYELMTAGQTDARGDTVRYVPGVGWVTEASPMSQSLINATDREQLQRLTGDSQLRRQGLQENSSRRMEEGRWADELMRRAQEVPEVSQQGIIQQLIARATEDTNAAYDDTINRTATQALRSGASNAGDVMSSINRQRGSDVRKAGLDANIQGMDLYRQLTQGQQGFNSNLYNQIASRASNFEDVPFQPTNVNETLANRNTGQMAGAQGAMNNVINSSGRVALRPGSEPDYSKANMWGGAASNIGGMVESYFANQQLNDLMKQFTNRQLGNV